MPNIYDAIQRTDSDLDYDLEFRVLSFESNPVASLHTKFMSFLGGVKADIVHSISTYFNPSDRVTNEYNKAYTGFASLKHKLGKIKYSDIKDRYIGIPEGLGVKMSVFGKSLTTVAIEGLVPGIDALDRLDSLLASIISNKETRASYRDYSDLGKEIGACNKLIRKELSKIYRKGSSKDKEALGELYGSINDMSATIADSKRVSGLYKNDTIKKLVGLVDSITEKLDVLIEEINKGDMEDISKQTLRNITICVKNAADFVNGASLSHYSFSGYLVTITRTMEFIKSI